MRGRSHATAPHPSGGLFVAAQPPGHCSAQLSGKPQSRSPWASSLATAPPQRRAAPRLRGLAARSGLKHGPGHRGRSRGARSRPPPLPAAPGPLTPALRGTRGRSGSLRSHPARSAPPLSLRFARVRQAANCKRRGRGAKHPRHSACGSLQPFSAGLPPGSRPRPLPCGPRRGAYARSNPNRSHFNPPNAPSLLLPSIQPTAAQGQPSPAYPP